MSGLPARLVPPDMDEAAVIARLIGGWQLVDWTTYHADGTRDQPFGADGIGQIMYSADRHMSCHLAVARRKPLGESYYTVSDAALGRTIRGYSGYWGSFSVDAAAGVVTHHVAGAWYPDFALADQPRRYGFAGDRLFLEADVGADLVRIIWRRREA